MQKVLNALKKMGIDATDTPELREQVAALTGTDPDSLTGPQAVHAAEAIAQAFERNAGDLTVAQSNKPTRGGKNIQVNRQDKTPELVQALKIAIGQSTTEVEQGIVAPIRGWADQYSTSQAAELAAIVDGLPGDTIDKFGEWARDYRGNPEFFRSQLEASLPGIEANTSGHRIDSAVL